MQGIPLAEKLRKRLHRTVSTGQDILVVEAYNAFPSAVLNGGTAIWRCYKGNRFSEDLDFYLPSTDRSRLDRLLANLDRRGLHKEKIKATPNAVFGKFSYLDVVVRFEASLRAVSRYALKPFEMVDGTVIMVKTLEQTELLREKVSAYMARRKVRDLYDVFFLLQVLEDKRVVKKRLNELLLNFKRPVDERELRALVISGSAPTVKKMLEVIGEWAR